MPRYSPDGTITFFPDETLDYALYGIYLQENYARMEDDGWVPLSPDEFFGDACCEPAEEYTNYLSQRMWQVTNIRYQEGTGDAVPLFDMQVGPAETREQAECLVALHELLAYVPGTLTYTLTRFSDMPEGYLKIWHDGDEEYEVVDAAGRPEETEDKVLCLQCGGEIFETDPELSAEHGEVVWSHVDDTGCDDPRPD